MFFVSFFLFFFGETFEFFSLRHITPLKERRFPSCVQFPVGLSCGACVAVKPPRQRAELRQERTSERGLHRRLHHPHQQLEALGVLCEARGERRKGVGMATQVLQGDPLTKISLQGERKAFL